jgi:hypothetical protein
LDTLQGLRIDLAARSQWNIGYVWAGFAYWSFAAVIGVALPIESAKVGWMIGGCAIFPAALLASWLLGADPFSRGNTLGSLIAFAHVSLIGISIPVLIAMFRDYPAGLLLAAGLFFGASFPVFFWAFGDAIFLYHFVVRVVGVIAIWFGTPNYRYSVLPAFVAIVYLGTALALRRRRAAWLRAQSRAGSETGAVMNVAG